jgi:PPK2 family polyphosphate:nucleotide phosphotransferase
VQHTSFGVPTEEERAQHYLQRIREALPTPGHIGVFDRSHYEDVLIARVRELAPPEVIEERYGQIVEFEEELVADEISIIKVMLHVSYEQQGRRLEARLDRPKKHWKFHPSDVDVRAQWPLYQEAYQAVLDRTSTEHAPWYVVPADSKWYARMAVGRLLREALEDLDLGWPPADFDIETERARLDAQPF